MENNIFTSEGFIFDIKLGYDIMEICKVKITIRAKEKDQFLRKKLLVKFDSMVILYSKVIVVLYPISFLDNRDFLFHRVA